MTKLEVTEIKTGKVVRTVEVDNPKKIEKTMLGLMINMDTDKYYINNNKGK